jgi:site-specific recombinase XerD
MGVKVRVKQGKLYLDIYQGGGKRKWESLRLTLTNDKSQNKEIMRLANICRSKREMQLLSGAWDIQDPVSSKKKLVTYLEEYAQTYTNPGIVRSCIYHIKKFRNGSIIAISQVTTTWVEEFQNTYLLKEAGISIASAYNYSKILRAALKKAVNAGILQKSPADTVKRLAEPETALIFLNSDEVQRLADTHIEAPYGAEIRRAFLFACHTGLRVSDMETITWSQIETNPMQIIKRQEKTKNHVYIPLSNSAQKLILEDGEEHDPGKKIFDLSLEHRRMSYNYLKQWAAKAKVQKNISWHTARRTFATMALENGVDIYTVAKLLGHKSIKQVAKYAKVTDKLRRSAVASLPEIKL